MKNLTLLGVPLPRVIKSKLKQTIQSLDSVPPRKEVLYFLYSEFLLRANRNPWYKKTLQNARLTAVDGKGIQWAYSLKQNPSLLPKLYGEFLIRSPYIFRVFSFLVCFALQLIWNLINGFYLLAIKKHDFSSEVNNELILGRDFAYDLLDIAQKKGWKTLILGGSQESDTLTRTIVNKLFPKLNLVTWSRSFKSLLMQDKILPECVGSTLNSENVCQFFPDLWEAKKYIKEQQPDLILVCLGGKSGRQEFFIDNISTDPEISFRLATGIGAALDHLGGGARQTRPPEWMVQSGLEWLFRFINQPYRRKRIIDSIITLWWWTTVEQFMEYGRERNTVVNILTNTNKEILLVKRRNILPGDIDWTFVQGGIEKGEDPVEAGKRELQEEVHLNTHEMSVTSDSIMSEIEPCTTSFLRFLLWGALYNRMKKHLVFIEYTGSGIPTPNWENREAKWVDHRDVISYLSYEKRIDWYNAVNQIKQTK